MQALLIEAHKLPKLIDTDKSLANYRKLLDCDLIDMPQFGDNYNDNRVSFIVDDEGKLNHKEFNRGIVCNSDDYYGVKKGELLDVICGSFLIVGYNPKTGSDCSLTESQIAKFEKIFHDPQILIKMNDQFTVIADPNFIESEQNQEEQRSR